MNFNNLQITESREVPPWVRFEQRAEEDRDGSIKANRLVMKDVDYVIVTRAGTKDTHERIAVEWLDHCEKLSRESPPLWPPSWVKAHRQMYDDWKSGKEVNQPGFPIREWAAITKAQAENCVSARVFTVESLAAADEATLGVLGMGARALKDKARAWLDANKGNSGEELAALRAENQTLKSNQEELRGKLAELEAALSSLQSGNQRKRA